MKWLLLIELLAAMGAVVSCVHYWRYPSPRRQRLAALLLLVCIVACGTTIYRALPGQDGQRLTPVQREQALAVQERLCRAIGRYVAKHYPGARVLLLVPLETEDSLPPERSRKAFADGGAEGIAALDVAEVNWSGSDYGFGTDPTPDEREALRNSAQRLIDLLDQYPDATVVVDQSGVLLQVPPAYVETHWEDGARPRLVEGIAMVIEDLEPFITAGWLDAGVVETSETMSGQQQAGEANEPVFVRPDNLEELRKQLDVEPPLDDEAAPDDTATPTPDAEAPAP